VCCFVSQVNSYPTDRGFTAIGTGGDDFVHSMVVAVESVLQESIPKVSTYSCWEKEKCSDMHSRLLFVLYLSLNCLLYSRLMHLEMVCTGPGTQKLSSRGKYVSVKIGPIRVVSSEQVMRCPLNFECIFTGEITSPLGFYIY
jgi:putative lipoic acid-binding regulatory protein